MAVDSMRTSSMRTAGDTVTWDDTTNAFDEGSSDAAQHSYLVERTHRTDDRDWRGRLVVRALLDRRRARTGAEPVGAADRSPVGHHARVVGRRGAGRARDATSVGHRAVTRRRADADRDVDHVPGERPPHVRHLVVRPDAVHAGTGRDQPRNAVAPGRERRARGTASRRNARRALTVTRSRRGRAPIRG